MTNYGRRVTIIPEWCHLINHLGHIYLALRECQLNMIKGPNLDHARRNKVFRHIISHYSGQQGQGQCAGSQLMSRTVITFTCLYQGCIQDLVLVGREVAGKPHLIILKTRTVKWFIMTLFEMIFWNCRGNFKNRNYLQRFVTSEKTLKTKYIKHAFCRI